MRHSIHTSGAITISKRPSRGGGGVSVEEGLGTYHSDPSTYSMAADDPGTSVVSINDDLYSPFLGGPPASTKREQDTRGASEHLVPHLNRASSVGPVASLVSLKPSHRVSFTHRSPSHP